MRPYFDFAAAYLLRYIYWHAAAAGRRETTAAATFRFRWRLAFGQHDNIDAFIFARFDFYIRLILIRKSAERISERRHARADALRR